MKVTRRGFKPSKHSTVNDAQRAAAEQILYGIVEECEIEGYGGPVHAELRSATYCGPESSGDRAAAVLDVSSPFTTLLIIESDGSSQAAPGTPD